MAWRRIAIIWTIADPLHRRKYVAIGEDELINIYRKLIRYTKRVKQFVTYPIPTEHL